MLIKIILVCAIYLFIGHLFTSIICSKVSKAAYDRDLTDDEFFIVVVLWPLFFIVSIFATIIGVVIKWKNK